MAEIQLLVVWKNKRLPYCNCCLCDFDRITVNLRAILHQITNFRPQSGHPRQSNDVCKQFQDGSLYLMSLHSSKVQNLSRNQISLRYNYFQFGKQTPAILEFFYRLLLRLCHSNRRAIPHQSTKFRPNRDTCGGVMTSYANSRWRQRWLNTSSGFVFDDVTSFHKILVEIWKQ